MTYKLIASVKRVAQHRNGTAAPYANVLFDTINAERLQALVFDAPGVLVVTKVGYPEEKYDGSVYEPELRAALEEVGLPIEHDPLGALHNRVSQLLTLVRQRRSETPAGPDHGRAKLRAIGRHLDTAKHAIARAMERAAQ
jgi:hypothetical protein